MIYQFPSEETPVDQGDIFFECPIVELLTFPPESPESPESPSVKYSRNTVVVLTQSCDLASQQTSRAIVAIAIPVHQVVEQKQIKPNDIKGPS